MPSFDTVSKVDMQEVDNAVNQVKKELDHRYDFRGSKSSIELGKDEITIFAEDNMKLKAMRDLLSEKIAKRGVGVKALEFVEPESATGGASRQTVKIKQGISQDDARAMVKLVKESGLKKVQAQIQGDQLRITGPKKDDLQAVMTLFRQKVELELQFVNFKD